jgi:DNA-binding NarL/FixJ family response regulator
LHWPQVRFAWRWSGLPPARRQKEVMHLTAQGLSNKQIEARLGISR